MFVYFGKDSGLGCQMVIVLITRNHLLFNQNHNHSISAAEKLSGGMSNTFLSLIQQMTHGPPLRVIWYHLTWWKWYFSLWKASVKELLFLRYPHKRCNLAVYLCVRLSKGRVGKRHYKEYMVSICSHGALGIEVDLVFNKMQFTRF